MDDGALTISLPAPLADDVRSAAEARGISPEEFVRRQIAMDVALESEIADDDFAVDEAIAAEFDRTGVGVPGDEVVAWLKSLGTDHELPRPQPRKLK